MLGQMIVAANYAYQNSIGALPMMTKTTNTKLPPDVNEDVKNDGTTSSPLRNTPTQQSSTRTRTFEEAFNQEQASILESLVAASPPSPQVPTASRTVEEVLEAFPDTYTTLDGMYKDWYGSPDPAFTLMVDWKILIEIPFSERSYQRPNENSCSVSVVSASSSSTVRIQSVNQRRKHLQKSVQLLLPPRRQMKRLQEQKLY